jgi:hypothetical protein
MQCFGEDFSFLKRKSWLKKGKIIYAKGLIRVRVTDACVLIACTGAVLFNVIILFQYT